METPQFIELKSNFGKVIINTNNILHVQPSKHSENYCIITFSEPIFNYKGIEFQISYGEIYALLQTKIR